MNALIIEDDQAEINALKEKLAQYPDITIAATASTGIDGIESIIKHKPDILFLDVMLPDTNGIRILDTLNEMPDIPVYVVIYTAHDDYILPAFRNHACDCLLKPIDDKELKIVMERFSDYINNGLDRFSTRRAKSANDKLIFYTNTEDFRIVSIQDICTFRYSAENRCWQAIASSSSKPMPLKRSVSKDSILSIDNCFVQVSKRHIININYLMEVKDGLCHFYPPFDKINDVKVGRLFRRKLISRCCNI